MSQTKIEWTERTWNPVRGCSRTSPGCLNCYAERMAHRFSGPGMPYEGLTHIVNGRPAWTGKVRLVEEALHEPFHWRKPCRVFVNSMSDLFHEDVPDGFIDDVFRVMWKCPQHTFQVLTKRAERMAEYCSCRWGTVDGKEYPPAHNVWLLVSAESQEWVERRLPWLLRTPAAVRGVSLEPLLGPIDLKPRPPQHRNCCLLDHRHDGSEGACQHHGLDWVIIGGESGPNARPCHVAWIRSLVQQCRQAGVACFVKQLGSNPQIDTESLGLFQSMPWAGDRNAVLCLNDPKGADPEEWPEDLRVRQFPEVRHG